MSDDNLHPAGSDLGEQERWLRESQQAGGVGSYRFNLGAGLWKCTPTMEEIFGIGPDYPKTFQGWADIVAPEQREGMKAYFGRLVESGDRFDREYRIVRICDGRERWVHGRGEFLRGPSGAIASLIGTIMDVTDRKQADEHLRLSEEKFSTVFNRAPLLMSLSSLEEGRYLDVNRQFCEVSGFSRDEAIGRTSVELGWLNAGQRGRLLDAIRADGRVSNVELSLRSKDGRTVVCLFSGELIPVEGKALLLSIALDITERKKAEAALRTQERVLRSVVDANPESLFLLAPDGTFLMGNKTFAERQGRTLDELIGRNAREFLSPDLAKDRFAKLQKVVGSGESLTFEDVRDGRHIESRLFPIFGPSGEVEQVAVLAIDITERVRMQEQMNRTQRLESLGVLAGGIAHDFNNILTAILGNLSFSRRMIGSDHRAAARLAECEKATLRAGELTQQLLTFARGGAPVKGTVETGALLDEVLGFALRGSNVKGVLDLSPGLWCLDADEGQIGQLFNNLLINAKQAMPGGGTVTVRAVNEIVAGNPGCALHAGRYVAISVRDEGTGIPAENLARIFDPYFSTKAGGSGLGLASVHSIVRRHGGSVEVASVPGKGTEFVIRLPAAAPDETAGEPRCADGQASLPEGSGRILVMDDEDMLARLATMMLEDLGYRPEACRDGAEAVELYRVARDDGDPFAAVLLDLTVPGGMGGREAAARILELDPGAVLVVSSGYSNDPVLADFNAYGFRGVVAKPYAIGTLAAEMARVTKPPPRE